MIAPTPEKIAVEFPEKLGDIFLPNRYKVAWGGRGGAKSWAFARAALLLGRSKPLKILAAREYMNSLSESVYALLLEQIYMLGLDDFYTATKSEIVGKNGTRFFFAGLKTNPRSIKSVEGIDIAWVEEAENVSKESWDLLIPTVRKDGSEIWVVFNPNSKGDDTYQRFVVTPPEGAWVVNMNWRDNPWLPRALRQEMEECKRRSMADYLHIWEGLPKEDAGTTEIPVDKVRYWIPRNLAGLNTYLTVDPSGSGKKANGDWTAMTVWGLGKDRNYYVIRRIRDKFNLAEKWDTMVRLNEQYRFKRIGYEESSKGLERDSFEAKGAEVNYRLPIEWIPPRGHKDDRIRRLVPIINEGRFFNPETDVYHQLDGKTADLTQEWNREALSFPNIPASIHDDILDADCMIMDPQLQATFPNTVEFDNLRPTQKPAYNPLKYGTTRPFR